LEALKALTENEIAAIKQAVGRAEKRTSGELRIFIEDHTKDDPLDRAAFLFDKLEMNKTQLRNGVLIYIAFRDRKFSIIGDQGIHQKVGPEFWDTIKTKMVNHFKIGKIFEGLMDAIHDSGEALAKYFPHEKEDKNELSDDIIFGDQEK
jgi:uncharacterized membrane protein